MVCHGCGFWGVTGSGDVVWEELSKRSNIPPVVVDVGRNAERMAHPSSVNP